MYSGGTGNGLASPPHSLLARNLQICLSVSKSEGFLSTFSSGIASLSTDDVAT